MTALFVFLINIFTSALKKYVIPRFGDAGVHVIVFALAAIYAVYHFYGDQFPGLIAFVQEFLKVGAYAIAAYQVFLKYIPGFKQADASNE